MIYSLSVPSDFTITGIENISVLQSIRDKIATLPAGADWDKLKKEIADEVSPFLIDPNADAETQARQRKAAQRRATLLLRQHGFMAYQAAQHQVMERQADALPFWQYHTFGDGRVRDSHRALDGVTLPANHPFWSNHFPPWEFGCRCQVVPISAEEADEMRAHDKSRPPEKQLLFEGQEADRLASDGRLQRDNQTVSLLPKPDGFSWNPGDLRIPVDKLRDRYDKDIFDNFENFARQQIVEGNRSLWDWLGGKIILPPTAPTVAPTLAAPADFDGILKKLGLDKKMNWTETDVEAILKEFKKSNPVSASSVITVEGANLVGQFTRKKILSIAQELFDILPPEMVKKNKFPHLKVVLVNKGSLGSYGKGLISLNKAEMKNLLQIDPNQFKNTIWHEMMHWIHMDGPSDKYRQLIKNHFNKRTQGEQKITLPGYGRGVKGKLDKWYDAYAGRLYSGISTGAEGIEVPTRYFELLADPEKLIVELQKPNAASTMETLKVVTEVLK
ncbi:MAG: phage minor head protein [Verrucomicrobiota bacterium]|nr:phage minor head protein [Verrucomicrobiota bacterium]